MAQNPVLQVAPIESNAVGGEYEFDSRSKSLLWLLRFNQSKSPTKDE